MPEAMDIDQPAIDLEGSEQKKKAGNEAYKKGDYAEAVALYSEAIDLAPTIAANYGNRGAAYMMQEKYKLALADCMEALNLDKDFVKAHMRASKCYLALGNLEAARRHAQSAANLEPHNAQVKQDLKTVESVYSYKTQAEAALAENNFTRASMLFTKALELSPQSVRLRLLKAEALVGLKDYPEALTIASDFLRLDSTNPDALYVRGLVLYMQGNNENAVSHFQTALKVDPDHSKSRSLLKLSRRLENLKKSGNEAFGAGRYQEAYDLYTEALGVDSRNVSMNSKLYCNRATAAAKLNKHEQTVADCTSAIELDADYTKAYLRRAQSYMDLGQFDDAIRDYELLVKKDRSNSDYQAKLRNAKLELKKSKRKDYYKILGVSKDADDAEIKKAYRRMALTHHPDKCQGTEEEKAEAEKNFKDVGEAFKVLSDASQRRKYDAGHDLQDDDGMGGFGGFGGFGGMDDMDPNIDIFQHIFGMGG
eukprot:Colp12_sorted_trinity150504_noHs@13270